jgi:hypothetical protein
MTHAVHDIGVANRVANYSDALETKPNLRCLTPGLSTGRISQAM